MDTLAVYHSTAFDLPMFSLSRESVYFFRREVPLQKKRCRKQKKSKKWRKAGPNGLLLFATTYIYITELYPEDYTCSPLP